MAFSITALTAQTTANNATPTYSSVTYGTCDVVVFGIIYGPPGTSVTITALSLNGVSGSQVSGAFANNSAQGVCGDMWYVLAPGGASGALSITFSGALNNGTMVQPWAVVTTSPTPTAGAKYDTGVGTTSASTSLVVPSGGGAMAVFSGLDVTTNTLAFTAGVTLDNTPTWSGQFVTVEGISGHSTGGSGSSTTVTATTTNSVNVALSVAAMDPGVTDVLMSQIWM